MNTTRFVLSATLCFFAAAGSADAAFVEYSASTTSAPTPFDTALSVQQFDPALGILTGISLSLSADFAAEVDVFNATSTAQAFSNAFASIPLTFQLSGPQSFSLDAMAAALLANGVAAPGFSSFLGAYSSATANFAVSTSDFASYVGPGALTFGLAASSGSGSFGGNALSGVFFGGAALADGRLTVRYDYETASAVPLPPSAWMLGAGLLMMTGLERRHRSAAKQR